MHTMNICFPLKLIQHLGKKLPPIYEIIQVLLPYYVQLLLQDRNNPHLHLYTYCVSMKLDKHLGKHLGKHMGYYTLR